MRSNDIIPNLRFSAVLPRRAKWSVSTQGSGKNSRFSFKMLRRADDLKVLQFPGISTPRTRVWAADSVLDVRLDFLSIQDPVDAKKFFERYGPFQLTRPRKRVHAAVYISAGNTFRSFLTPEDLGNDSTAVMALKARPIGWRQLCEVRDSFKHALLEGEPDFQQVLTFHLQTPKPFRLEIDPSDGTSPIAFATCLDVNEAIQSSLLLSRLTGTKWKQCERGDCAKIFEQISGHERKFCSRKCSHLHAVRKFNGKATKSKKRKKVHT